MDAAAEAGSRALGTSAFRCDAGTCTQWLPRVPDDGDWECTEMFGAIVCRGGTSPAGVVPGAPAEGWRCGERTSARPAASDAGPAGAAPDWRTRICVALESDAPPGPDRYACQFEYGARAIHRVCRKSVALRVGDACDVTAPCPRGTSCSSGRCAAPELPVSCWLDADCARGACLFGSCREDVP